jgi:protein gp37
MSEHSPIEWTDHTFNPWWGCAKVSPGCDHCYAERDAKRFFPAAKMWGTRAEGAVRRVFEEERKHWGDPLRWNKRAIERGVQTRARFLRVDGRRVRQPPWRRRRARTPMDAHPQDARARLAAAHEAHRQRRAHGAANSWLTGHWPTNAWLGISVVNQEEADRDIPKLLATPARVRFLSIEPMLGPIEIGAPRLAMGLGKPQRLDWVIAGGESGPHARPAHPDWFPIAARPVRGRGRAVPVQAVGRVGPVRDADVIDRGEYCDRRPADDRAAPSGRHVARAEVGQESRRPPARRRAARRVADTMMMLTPAELAAHYRVSERTVARMVADGCPSRMVGHRRRFVLAEVEAWSKERACPSGKTSGAVGTPKRASPLAVGFTDAARRVQVRATPSA